MQIHIMFYIKNNQNISYIKKCMIKSIKIINLRAKNGPVGWNGLTILNMDDQ